MRTDGFVCLIAAPMPEASPPPPAGTNTVADVGALLEDLEAGGALAGDDLLVIERRHDRQAARARFLLGARLPIE